MLWAGQVAVAYHVMPAVDMSQSVTPTHCCLFRMGHSVASVLGPGQLAVAVVCHVMPAVRELAVWGLLQPPLFRLAWLYGCAHTKP